METISRSWGQSNENGTTSRIFKPQYGDNLTTKLDEYADTRYTISAKADFTPEEVGRAILYPHVSFDEIETRLARVLPEAIASMERINIEEPPEGAISIKGDSVEIDSKKLSRDTYYPVLFRGEKHFVQVGDRRLTLYESFELKNGVLLLNKLFEIRSE